MSLTTTIATVVQRGGIFGSHSPPSDQPAVPTGRFDDLPDDNPHHITKAAAVAISVSSVSLILSAFMIYWFVRMRRRYRHDLIMMLIASNIFRAFWRLFFPVVEYFKHGIFPTESVFCQVSGFCISLGVEGTDIAILLIAIHSALSVFSKNASRRQGGLYPYRRWALALWVIFPVTIAAAAFANPDQLGYSAQGSICYLPSRPYKFINLTWIPRYFVASVVLVVYTSIYFYATHKSRQYQREIMSLSRMQTYDKRGWLSRISSWFRKGDPNDQSLQQGENFMTAKDMRNFGRGLHLSRGNSVNYGLYSIPHPAFDSSLELETSGYLAANHHPRLPGGSLGFPPHELQELSRPPIQDNQNSLDNEPSRSTTTTTMTDAFTSAAHDFAQGTSGTAEEFEAPQTLAEDTRRIFPGTNVSIPQIRCPEPALSRRTSLAPSLADSLLSISSVTSAAASSVLSRTDTQNDVPKMLASSQIIAQHERMRRQLRYLFFYPAAYILLWIAPFILHILRMYPEYYNDPSFALNAFVITCASIQAGVNCILFSYIEKPWKHIPGSDGSFLGSFKCLEIRRRRKKGQVQDPAEIQERLARQLRDLERVDQRSLESDLSRPRVRRPRSSSHDGERYWWEQFEDDEDGEGRPRSSNRTVSLADSMDLSGAEERGRERRRRVSFPNALWRPKGETWRPRSESFVSETRSISSRASSDRRRSGQEDDWHRNSKQEPQSREREGRTDDEGDKEESRDEETLHEVRLNEAGDVEEGENLEDVLTPSKSRVIDSDDHG